MEGRRPRHDNGHSVRYRCSRQPIRLFESRIRPAAEPDRPAAEPDSPPDIAASSRKAAWLRPCSSVLAFRTLRHFNKCTLDETGWDALEQAPVYRNAYTATRILLKSGAHTIDNRRCTKGVLTKDGHRLSIAGLAVRRNPDEVLRALEDAGYREIVADARLPGFRNLVHNVGIGGQIGGLFGGFADCAVGAAPGGSASDFRIASAGSSILDSGSDGEAAPSQISDIAHQRKLARYLVTAEMPPEAEPPSIDSPNSETRPPSQKHMFRESWNASPICVIAVSL
ncbi:hypothetical protein [uncultured Parasphingorhabdus sp.]|uniref:hypothetical protein n=1 Tax=uncultured Parasphingorhabdus sp. TaxID=2709694 RepID=UPI002AA66ED7|nr:hypothetical protein [uncultured Parasphingorhabdus sp.]